MDQYFGYGVIGEIIYNFGKLNPTHPMKNALLFGLVRSLLSIFYRLYAQEKLDFTLIEIVQIFGITFNTWFSYFSIYAFMVSFLFDLKRKVYCQSQCALILSPTQLSYLGVTQVLPTINIMSTNSLKCSIFQIILTYQFQILGWSILRRVLLQYGQTYHTRLEVYMSFFVALVFIILIVAVLWFLRIIKLPTIVLISFVFQLVTLLIMIFLMLYRGALINKHFQHFQNILDGLLVISQDLIRMKKIYILDDIVPQSIIKKQSIEQMKEMYGNAFGKLDINQFTDALEDQQRCLKELKSQLENDERNNPFTFFGITITLVLIKSLSASILTILAGAAQYYIFSDLGYIPK